MSIPFLEFLRKKEKIDCKEKTDEKKRSENGFFAVFQEKPLTESQEISIITFVIIYDY